MTEHFTCDISTLWLFCQNQEAARLRRAVDLNHKNKNQPFYFYGRLTWEFYRTQPSSTQFFEDFIDGLISSGVRVVLFVNTIHQTSDYLEALSRKYKIVFVDYFLWRVYNEVMVKNKSKMSPEWNRDATKFLFLTGKANKAHRVGLLYKFSQAGLLSSAIWSLLLPENLEDIGENVFLPDLDRQQFLDWLQQHRSNPDGVDFLDQPGGLIHYGGIPYDAALYSQSLFRVISETNSYDEQHAWITEKTWLTILNRVPFIMAGDRYILARLESRGFKTFREYQAVPEYDTLWNEDRMDAVVTNTKNWLTNMTNKDQIQADVEHNHAQFLALALLNRQKIAAAIEAPDLMPDDVLPTNDWNVKSS